ncbi:hypothetical protein D3C86_1408960 [compost metagenome]
MAAAAVIAPTIVSVLATIAATSTTVATSTATIAAASAVTPFVVNDQRVGDIAVAAVQNEVEQRRGGRAVDPVERLDQQLGGLGRQRQIASERDSCRSAQDAHAGKERLHRQGGLLGAGHGGRDGHPAAGAQEGVLGGKEGGQTIEPVESPVAQDDALDRQDPVDLAMLIQHLFTGLQRFDGALAAIGHQDAGAGDEAGLGMGLVWLPLVMVEVIAEGGGKQGQGDGRSQQQSALAGFERGQ